MHHCTLLTVFCVFLVFCCGCDKNAGTVSVPNADEIVQVADTWPDDPICTLNTNEMNAQVDEYRQALMDELTGLNELENGYEFSFSYSIETLESVLTLIRKESACCVPMNFQLVVRPSQEKLSLRLTGSPSVKELIRSFLDSK